MTIARQVGPTLVNATLDELKLCINLGRYPVLKVVATNKYGLIDPSTKKTVDWNDASRDAVCELTRWTIVRTQTGDGNDTSAGNDRWIEPGRIRGELLPWYKAKQNSSHKINPPSPPGWSNLLIELGNESNNAPNFINTPKENLEDRRLFIWRARWHLLKAIDEVKKLDQEFQVTTKIICTSIAPYLYWVPGEGEGSDKWWVAEWLRIFGHTDPIDGRPRNAVDECNFAAVHFFAKTAWDNTDGNNMHFMVDTYTNVIGARRGWIVTEFGLRCPPEYKSQCDDYTKGYRNAGLMHFGEPRDKPLPSHVWGGTYFQLNTIPVKPEPQPVPYKDYWETDYGYAYFHPNGDWSYRNRLNSGA